MAIKARREKTRKLKDGISVRHAGVIIEHIDHKFDLLADQYLDIGQKLDSHSEKLDSHSEMIGSLTIDMQAVKVDVAIIKTDIEFIKGGLRKKVDTEEFGALERRVALLGKRAFHK